MICFSYPNHMIRCSIYKKKIIYLLMGPAISADYHVKKKILNMKKYHNLFGEMKTCRT